ncbi:MAG: thiamine-phosphate pyrophosphorylase [Rickettsiales bacterium]|jgi:thiamine-phosphate pyrophosphorylase
MTKIYLISPSKIENSFFLKLENILATKLVSLFQLRLKNYDDQDIIAISKKVKDICRKYKVKFVLNDRFNLAVRVGADGAHLGRSDAILKEVMLQKPKNFLIGVSCYDDKGLIHKAAESGVDYISLGAFFPTKTKKTTSRPDADLIKYCKNITNIPLVAIGGINDRNCQTLIENKIDYLAVISYIWDNEGREVECIKKLSILI